MLRACLGWDILILFAFRSFPLSNVKEIRVGLFDANAKCHRFNTDSVLFGFSLPFIWFSTIYCVDFLLLVQIHEFVGVSPGILNKLAVFLLCSLSHFLSLSLCEMWQYENIYIFTLCLCLKWSVCHMFSEMKFNILRLCFVSHSLSHCDFCRHLCRLFSIFASFTSLSRQTNNCCTQARANSTLWRINT